MYIRVQRFNKIGKNLIFNSIAFQTTIVCNQEDYLVSIECVGSMNDEKIETVRTFISNSTNLLQNPD